MFISRELEAKTGVWAKGKRARTSCRARAGMDKIDVADTVGVAEIAAEGGRRLWFSEFMGKLSTELTECQ